MLALACLGKIYGGPLTKNVNLLWFWLRERTDGKVLFHVLKK